LICAFGPSTTDATITLRRFKLEANKIEASDLIASWDAPCPNPDLECDVVINLQYFADTSCCCLVLAGGDVVLVRETPLSGEEQIEIVGSVDDGISSARWSPDEDLLALCSRSQSLLLMSRYFEGVADVKFSPEDINASHHVSVGWGKAETQFKGKRARALRDPTVPENVDEGRLSSQDDRKTTITWRGDGEYVAVNSIEANTCRLIRVYSRDGELDSASEPVDYLEGALSWRPVGNLLAGVQRREDRADIVFFERNGLRHGQFSLRLSKDELHDWGSTITLEWNVDSTVLAVIFDDRVQLWTMGNYHYYLKQTIHLTSDAQRLTRICWNPENPLQCAVYQSGEHSISTSQQKRADII
jgi:elongator complex protein 1